MSIGPQNKSRKRRQRQIDFVWWARKAYWYPLEAAALSLSVDPDYFRLVSPDDFRNSEEFEPLRDRIDLVEREMTARDEKHGLRPSTFVEWALSIQLELPQRLRTAIERVSGRPKEWRAKYEEARAQVEDLQRQVDEAKATVEALKKHEREDRRRSLQKLVIGIAISRYEYLPGKRTDAARKIAADLRLVQDENASAGPPLSKIGLDEDTVRAHLTNALAELSDD